METCCGGTLARDRAPSEHGSPLLLCEERQLAQPPLGSLHGCFQEGLVAGHQPCDGGRVEQVRAVLQHCVEPLRSLEQIDTEVELRRAAFHIQGAEAQPRQLQGGCRHGLQLKHHLDERRVAEGALRRQILHQLLEREILVCIGVQAYFTHSPQQLAEGRIAGKVGAQHQGVDEKADQPLGLGAHAPGDRRSQDHVRLVRVAQKQRLEAGQQRHEERDTLPPAQLLQAHDEDVRQPELQRRSIEGVRREARPIRRQPQERGGAGELPPPVIQLPRKLLALHPLALPDSEVGILDRRRRQGRRVARSVGVVEDRQLARGDGRRPAIRDDVMHGDQQDVLLGGQTYQTRPQERTSSQVEGPPRLGVRQAADLLLALLPRERLQIDHGQSNGEFRQDHLIRPPFDGDEDGAQNLVTAQQSVQAAPERGDLQTADHAQRDMDVVNGTIGHQLVEEPLPFLREREGHVPGPRPRPQRRRRRQALSLPAGGLNAGGQLHHGRVFEQASKRQLDLESIADARDNLGGQQRMPSQCEEASLASDPIEPQNLRPDSGDDLRHGIDSGSRPLPRRLLFESAGPLGNRQGVAIHFAAGRQREALQKHEGRRHHVPGQAREQVLTELGDGDPPPGEWDRVGRQALFAGRCGAHRNGRAADRRMPA